VFEESWDTWETRSRRSRDLVKALHPQIPDSELGEI
jgi:hypothetical protein